MCSYRYVYVGSVINDVHHIAYRDYYLNDVYHSNTSK